MLNRRTRANYGRRVTEVAAVQGVDVRGGSPQAAHREVDAAEDKAGTPVRSSPVMFRTSFDLFRKTPTLHEEIFGPGLIVVVCDSEEQLGDAAASVQGSLTGTIWAAAADAALARRVEMILEQRVGRIIFNGVPTGVEVSPAMVHGGPYPATSRPESTAVGPESMRRWTRPVCYQNVPEAFLPPELRNSNPLKIRRRVNGEWMEGGVPRT
jgi:NADP-dependent aldehyde dehydrogenase